MEGETIYLYFW